MSAYFRGYEGSKTKDTSTGLTILVLGIFLTLFASFGVANADSGTHDVTAVAGVTEMKPAAGDTHHLEVKPETLEAYRIPGMKITVTAIPEGGGPEIVKQLDEMFGGNFHYGVNLALEAKKYTLKFHLEPPTFMREGKRANQWLTPIDAEFPFDGAAPVAISGKIGTKETPDMKIAFETEEAESIFVLAEKDATHMTMESAHLHDEEEMPTSDNSGTRTALTVFFSVILGFVLGRFLFRTA
jgi:hypothetical protein